MTQQPQDDEQEGMLYGAALVEYARGIGDVLREQIAEEIEKLKGLSRASKSLPQLQYLVELHKLNPALGQEMLDKYVGFFARVTDKPVGLQMRALRDAAALLSRKQLTRARVFLDDGSVEPVPVAARRLHDGLLTMRRGPEYMHGLREVLREIVINDMRQHAAWPLLEEFAQLVGQELEIKLTENQLDDFFDVLHRLLPFLAEDETSQKRAVDILRKLSATEGSGIELRKAKVVVAEEPVEDAG